MDTSRRKYRRWPVVCRVDFVDIYGRAWFGLIKDLSPEGLFVEYVPELRIGSTIGTSFALPGHDTVKLMAKVVRVTEKGVGLQFIGLNDDAQNPYAKSLKTYCEELHDESKNRSTQGDDAEKEGMIPLGALEKLMPTDHPLLRVRWITNQLIRALSGEFSEIHLSVGRFAIPPEQLLRALLVKALYSIRTEQLLLEQLRYNLLLRGFVGIDTVEVAWGVTDFIENRDRLLRTAVARRFLAEVARLARETGLLADDHFAVDWALLEAWISNISPSTTFESFSTEGKQGEESHEMC